MLLLVLFIPIYSQYGFDDGYMVIDSDGVLMREGPGTEHAVVKGIPFGEMLRRTEKAIHGKMDTISRLPGMWRYLKYESYEGFVFDAYISSNAQVYNLNYPKDYPQFTYDKLGCGSYLFFNKDLNWHAVVKNRRDYKFDMIPVSINFQVEYAPDIELEASPEYYVSPYLNISLDTALDVQFLVGLPKGEIRQSDIYKARLPVQGMAQSTQGRPMLPGDVIELGQDYKLYCFGEVTEPREENSIRYIQRFGHYSIKAGKGKKGEYTFQKLDIGPDEVITFVGDLNNDSINDIIVSTSPNWSETYTKLFMSGYGVETYREVAANYWGGCH